MAKYKFNNVSYKQFSTLVAFLKAYNESMVDEKAVESSAVLDRLREEQKAGDAVFGNLSSPDFWSELEKVILFVSGQKSAVEAKTKTIGDVVFELSHFMGTLVSEYRDYAEESIEKSKKEIIKARKATGEQLTEEESSWLTANPEFDVTEEELKKYKFSGLSFQKNAFARFFSREKMLTFESLTLVELEALAKKNRAAKKFFESADDGEEKSPKEFLEYLRHEIESGNEEIALATRSLELTKTWHFEDTAMPEAEAEAEAEEEEVVEDIDEAGDDELELDVDEAEEEDAEEADGEEHEADADEDEDQFRIGFDEDGRPIIIDSDGRRVDDRSDDPDNIHLGKMDFDVEATDEDDAEAEAENDEEVDGDEEAERTSHRRRGGDREGSSHRKHRKNPDGRSTRATHRKHKGGSSSGRTGNIVINIYTGDTEQSVRPHKPTVVKKVKLVRGEPKTVINPYIPDDVPELPDDAEAVPADVTGGNNVVPIKKPTDKELSKKKSARKRAAEAYKRATEKFSALCEEAGRFDIDTLLQEIQYSLTGEGGLKSEIDALNKEIRSLRSKIARRTKNNEDFTELQTELDQKDAERKEKQEKRDALKARYRKISKAQQSADDRWVDVKNASVVYINYLEGEIVKAADAGELEYAEALEKKLEEAKRFLERSFERGRIEAQENSEENV